MKQIDVQAQPILSARRTMQIALTGVRYRLFRASVTVAVIVVAMAFLMNILTESLIRRSVAVSARARIEDLHRIDQWIARLSIAPSSDEIIGRLANAETADRFTAELAALMKRSPESLESYRAAAGQANTYLEFFAGLPFGRKRLLVGRAEGVNIFDRLTDHAAWEKFRSALTAMKSVQLPTDAAAFEQFLRDWPGLQRFLDDARQAYASAIEQVQQQLNGQPLADALLQAGGSFGSIIRAAGFVLASDEAKSLAADEERIQNVARIEKTINNAGVRQAVAASRDMLPGDVTIDLIWTMLSHKDKAAWFLTVMAANEADTGALDANELVALARYRAQEQLLKKAERHTMEAGGGFAGIGRRMTWLALVSMLVCAVGIANAMLMSVTERFREIATLKCLGALDGFIMMVFLIEAAVLGLVGGLGGSLAGLILGAGRMLLSFRSLMFSALPVGDLALAGVISIVSGLVLAAAAAVYPSLRAARLAPMEAMRIE